jgi:glucose/arabinose dehydrogenase
MHRQSVQVLLQARSSLIRRVADRRTELRWRGTYGASHCDRDRDGDQEFSMLRIRYTADVLAACALLGGLLVGSGSDAHPVFAPFDDTQFAPITRFGPLITLAPVATQLTAPNKGVAAPGDGEHLYVVDQAGAAWKVNLADGAKSVFFSVQTRLVPLGVLGPGTFDERGFLGLAFHPKFLRNGLLYTYTSEPVAGAPTFTSTLPPGASPDHQNVVAEWRLLADGSIGMRRELMRIDWPQFNHNGGDMAFGPDRMLYISTGDGGNADDQGVGHLAGGNAQNLRVPLGKILRIDVDRRNSSNGAYGIPADNPFVRNPNALNEIFAYGFRNPFRISFDRERGDLYVGDVGQNDIEEVDLVVASGNFGWNIKEGTLFFDPKGEEEDGAASPSPVPGRTAPPGLIDPIAQYDTHLEGHSVILGSVYRGEDLHQLRGRLIFGDFSRLFNFPSGPHDYGRLFHVNAESRGRRLRAIREFHITPSNAPNLAVLGFGEDAKGEIYLLGNASGVPFGDGGVVLRLAPAPAESNEPHTHDDE